MDEETQTRNLDHLDDEAYTARWDALRDETLPIIRQLADVISRHPEKDFEATREWLQLVRMQIMSACSVDAPVLDLADFHVSYLTPLMMLAYRCSADKSKLDDDLRADFPHLTRSAIKDSAPPDPQILTRG